MKIGKLVAGVVVASVVVAVAAEVVKQTGLKDKAQEKAEVLVAKGTNVLADLLTRYDEWTNSFVGDDESPSPENSGTAHRDPWASATHDEQGAGTR